MKRIVAFTLASTVGLVQLSSVAAQNVGAGMVSGTISGPTGPLAGVTVQAVNATGTIVGTAVTDASGAFSISGLTAGTLTLNAIAANGAVIGVSTATLAEGAMAVVVSVNATAGVLAASAAAAAGAVTAGAVTSTTVLAAIGAAAGALGTIAVIANKESASGSN